jgi:hypothetical protein
VVGCDSNFHAVFHHSAYAPVAFALVRASEFAPPQ